MTPGTVFVKKKKRNFFFRGGEGVVLSLHRVATRPAQPHPTTTPSSDTTPPPHTSPSPGRGLVTFKAVGLRDALEAQLFSDVQCTTPLGVEGVLLPPERLGVARHARELGSYRVAVLHHPHPLCCSPITATALAGAGAGALPPPSATSPTPTPALVAAAAACGGGGGGA